MVGFVGCVWVVCYLVLICGQAAVLVVCGCFYLRLLLVWLGDWHCSFASCFVYRFLFRGWFVLGDCVVCVGRFDFYALSGGLYVIVCDFGCFWVADCWVWVYWCLWTVHVGFGGVWLCC